MVFFRSVDIPDDDDDVVWFNVCAAPSQRETMVCLSDSNRVLYRMRNGNSKRLYNVEKDGTYRIHSVFPYQVCLLLFLSILRGKEHLYLSTR